MSRSETPVPEATHAVPRRHGIDRRQLARGAAWAVPALALAAAAPAVAASNCEGEAVTQTFAYSGAVGSFTLPASLCDIYAFEVVGGSGGGNNSLTGRGASLRGTFTAAAGTPIRLIVGGGGQGGSASEGVFQGGWGYGRGGSTSAATPPERGGGAVGGGGGGSALFLGAATNDTTLLVAAGGGGGGRGSTGFASNQSEPVPVGEIDPGRPDGGTTFSGTTAPGANGQKNYRWTWRKSNDASQIYYGWTIQGANGGTGTAGGSQGGANTAVTPTATVPTGMTFDARTYRGTAGQGHGSGLNGGGNGGTGAVPWGGTDVTTRTDLRPWMPSGAGGGGGYTGGGGGSNAWMTAAYAPESRSRQEVWWSQGGGGSSYVSTAAALTATGVGPAGSTYTGADGVIRITWYR